MNKVIKYFFLLFFIANISTKAEIRFNNFFIDSTLRYDFLLGGDSSSVQVYPQQMKKEGEWAGSKNHLINQQNLGTFQVRIFDKASGRLIFSKGFSPLFMEWQTTAEAKHQKRTFYQAVFVPFPKKEIILKIDQRQWNGKFEEIHSQTISPDNYFIISEMPSKFPVEVIQKSGKVAHCVDLVFLAEGYTKDEMDKFIADVKCLSDYLFESAPFSKHRNQFNVYAICSPSEESGTDVPGKFIYRNTIFNSTFYTFDISRYLTTSDMKSIYDATAQTPCDQFFILVNTDQYGGGGFYNFLGICSADNQLSENVFVHEFGHQFAGLADEYYTSSVAYNDFYNLEVEPWEPNITTLVDFDSKWKDMLSEETPIPTPRKKEYSKATGVFEGGGYLPKGIYSPMMNCRMKSNEVSYFCPVCSRAIERAIEATIE